MRHGAAGSSSQDPHTGVSRRLAACVELRRRTCVGGHRGLHLRQVSDAPARTLSSAIFPPEGSPMKTSMSRFQIHDDLTAPEGSVPVLRGALATGGQLPNFLGALAGSPAALRGYARFRSELRRGALDVATLERISLAIAEHDGSRPGIAMHNRTARQAGLPLDELAAARRFDSRDEKQ